MKVVCTGAAGFIGSHLCETLIANGDDVIGIDNLSTGDHRNITKLETHYRDKFNFLCCSAGAKLLVQSSFERCDCVYHLASSVGVRRIIERPVEAVRNICGTTDVVLKLCARYRKPVLITSTSEVYGKGNAVPFREDDDVVLGPTNSPRWSYAAAKMVDEFLALAYFRESGLPCRVVRLFNTVGPRQTGTYGMVVPNFVAQAKRGVPLTVYGDGSQTRCFTSVHDIVPGLVDIMACEASAGQVVNLGSDEEISILDLALHVIATTKSDSPIQYVTFADAYGVHFDDMARRKPDLSRARDLIGWKPKWTLAEILRELCYG